jgi:pimeloyl-ACP methyl ester carboxylesterase
MADMWADAIATECKLTGHNMFDLIGVSWGTMMAHQIALSAQRGREVQPRKLVLVEPLPPAPWSIVPAEDDLCATARKVYGELLGSGEGAEDFKKSLATAPEEDLIVIVAERAERVGRAPFTASTVRERNQELRVVNHLTNLMKGFIRTGLSRHTALTDRGPEFDGSVLLVLATERVKFFVDMIGLTNTEAGFDAVKSYWPVAEQVEIEGAHTDVCARCLANSEPQFTGALQHFLTDGTDSYNDEGI